MQKVKWERLLIPQDYEGSECVGRRGGGITMPPNVYGERCHCLRIMEKSVKAKRSFVIDFSGVHVILFNLFALFFIHY